MKKQKTEPWFAMKQTGAQKATREINRYKGWKAEK